MVDIDNTIHFRIRVFLLGIESVPEGTVEKYQLNQPPSPVEMVKFWERVNAGNNNEYQYWNNNLNPYKEEYWS